MHFTCRSFIGHPQSGNWSQYWENEPDERVIFSTHGHLFGLINLISLADGDVGLIGRDIINQINTAYYSDNNHDIKSSINSVISLPEYQGIHISLIVAVIVDWQLNLFIYNHGEVVLKRGGNISHLLTGSEDGSVFLSGKITTEDQIFLSTSDFFQSLSWSRIKTFLSAPKVQDIEENFLAFLYSLEDQSSQAGAYIQVHDDEDNLVIEEETIPNSHPVIPSPVVTPAPKQNILSKFLPKDKPIFISRQDGSVNKKRQRINIFISVFLIVCLCGSSVYGYRQNQKNQTETNYQQLKTELEKKLENALTIKNLSLDTALNQAKESQVILTKMSSLKIHPEEVSQFQQKVSSLLSQTGSVDNFSPSVFYDATLIANDTHFSQLILNKEVIYLLDPVGGRIDQVNISKKSTKNISQAAEIKGSSYMAENSDSVYLLKNAEIFLVDKDSLSSKIKITDSVKDFTSGQFGFWNGSLYLLSTADASIWKFAPNSAGFSPGQSWLKDDQRLPASPSSMAINGNIWVIGQNGALIPYTHGSKVDFKLSSVPAVTSGNNLTTSPDSDLIAFSDAGSSIYVFKKDGQSVAHFNLGSRQISSMAVDSSSNSVFVLCTDQKIYKISW